MATRLPEFENQAEARILFVDSDEQGCAEVTQMLDLVGYQVHQATSGERALAQLELINYDLMLLETWLPDLNSVEIMDASRQLQGDLIIIVLTGSPTLESAIAAVRNSAADYLCKPISPRDVVLRVTHVLHEKIIRRKRLTDQVIDALNEDPVLSSANPVLGTAGQPETKSLSELSTDQLSINPSRRTATLKDAPKQEIQLTRGETAVLTSLMAYAEKVLSCQQLARHTWGYKTSPIEAESLIRPYIFRLRRKLESDPRQPQIIRTVRGQGYVFTNS